MATGTAHCKTGVTQFFKDRPLANQTTISDSRKLRVTVVSTAMNRETARIIGKAVILEKAARPSTTSGPIVPLAASPNKRTRSTLRHTIRKVDSTTALRRKKSDTEERLNKDI